MNILHYLYQPDKSALSPFSRAFVAWLEIAIIAVIGAGVAAALDYLNGHPNDFSGALPFIESAIAVAFLKSFTTLGVSLKNASGTTTQAQTREEKSAPVQVIVHPPSPLAPVAEPTLEQPGQVPLARVLDQAREEKPVFRPVEHASPPQEEEEPPIEERITAQIEKHVPKEKPSTTG